MSLTSSNPAASETPEQGIERLLREGGARDPKQSQFDYIIVGSGAGGGPLAARLALAGKKVLVIEAGPDPAKTESHGYPEAKVGEVTEVPGYYAAASEDAEMSWMFSVRHYENTARQKKDEKYNQIPIDPNTGAALDLKFLDPHPTTGGKQGVFYPRSSGVGGCTAHHAMITIAPNDKDWNYIAELTGDNSWRSGPMRGYFAKLERCQYLAAYDQFFRKLLGIFYRIYRWIVLIVDPRAVLDQGGHGFKGWAPTNLIDPFLVSTIAKTDRPFFRVIVQAALAVLHGNYSLIAALKHALVRLRVVQAIDFNDVNTRRTNPEGVFLIPIGTEGGNGTDDEGEPGKGRRFGVRELVLSTARKHPDRLVIKSGAHVTRVLFEKTEEDETPRAIGVECALGDHLYEASPIQKKGAPADRVCFFTKKRGGEVILCGGAFNTPQLLMLSGIGDADHLSKYKITQLYGVTEAQTSGDEETEYAAKELPGVSAIHLPGVGSNLQDRYEVTVVSELNKDFDTLKGVSFKPGDSRDPARQQWLDTKSGLYTTNGGTLAVIRRSKPAEETGEPEPDLFTFGAPAAFRGYYWNWSRELFKGTLDAKEEKHRLWSWVILKAYTRNHHGTVRLRSDDPFAMPEICFDAFNEKAELEAAEIDEKCQWYLENGAPLPPELEEHRSLNESRVADSKRDLGALIDAVAFMRKVNARNPDQFVREIQPGIEIPDFSTAMEEWVKTQAWGHHASCTCRIGSDKWTADPRKLNDRCAVLDSRFRVHGVKNLRVVDASVFPKIPGYFIFAPIFMISEKAADTVLEDATVGVYPAKFEAAEAAAVRKRRDNAHQARREPDRSATPNGEKEDINRLPPHTVGLALSGGGIRSATFALGVLQAMAERGRLRNIDFLSTVSGGGFTGSFLGRLFTRDSVTRSEDPVGRVQDILKNSRSGPLWWLRTQANYIFATGSEDLRLNLSVLWRNIFTVHLVVGALLFALFGLLAWLPRAAGEASDRLGLFQLRALVEPVLTPPILPTVAKPDAMKNGGGTKSAPPVRERSHCRKCKAAVPPSSSCPEHPPHSAGQRDVESLSPGGIRLSAWWWLPLLALGLAVIPATLGYWLAPNVGSYRRYPVFALLAWLVLVAGAGVALQFPHALPVAGAGLLVLLLAWLWQEVARWGATKRHATLGDELKVGTVVRNRLSRGLGEALTIFALLVGWVVLDTLAIRFAQGTTAKALAAIMVALGPLLPLLRWIGMGALKQISAKEKKGWSLIGIANLLGIPLAIFLLFVLDVIVHRLFIVYPTVGVFLIGLTALFSLAIGRAFDFLNLSTLRAAYAARLARTFLGASNEERIYGSTTNEGRDVSQASPKDDIAHDQYHPEHHGGPLHLINVCVNETVDLASEREVRERKGLPMCVTPQGVSVGRSYFAEWTRPDAFPRWQKRRRWRDGFDLEDLNPAAKRRLTALRALPVSSNPNAFHVLQTTKSESAEVESLSLGAWTSISGAAFSTGVGRGTKLSLALFMGLVNVRLGYWWDSGILEHERPGRYPPPLWRRIKRLPNKLFGAQSMLLSEWRARFRGPSQWFWYLSDGGHFDVTGLYELLRRRVPFMIVTEAGEDPQYRWGDVALITQQAREDFGAEIVWLDWNTARTRADEIEKGSLATGQQGVSENDKTEKERRRERWQGILQAYFSEAGGLDEWIQEWIDPDRLGTLNDIHREGKFHAALGRVTYDGEPYVAGKSKASWILLLKPSIAPDLTQDILNYATTNETFPQDPTVDQVFDDIQWESYRALGQQIAKQVLI